MENAFWKNHWGGQIDTPVLLGLKNYFNTIPLKLQRSFRKGIKLVKLHGN